MDDLGVLTHYFWKHPNGGIYHLYIAKYSTLESFLWVHLVRPLIAPAWCGTLRLGCRKMPAWRFRCHLKNLVENEEIEMEIGFGDFWRCLF